MTGLICLQVTYRVVQVTDDQLEATADGGGAVSVVSTAAFAGATQAVAQVSKRAEQNCITLQMSGNDRSICC